jgi:YggT family protein
MNIFIPILTVIDVALQLYWWVLIVYVIMSWLTALNVINTHNQIVRSIGNVTYQLTEPVLRRIRRVIPSVGNVDLSAIALFLLIMLVRMYIRTLIFS